MSRPKIKLNLVIEFDDTLPPSVWDDSLKLYFQRKFGEIELLSTFGGQDYVLIIKDKIFDKPQEHGTTERK
mgnify:CR=1 FL=1